ncbi:MAG: XrtA/PEP-CTERM system exopolysaccharide export protein [Gammaproteobacteria bacterium]
MKSRLKTFYVSAVLLFLTACGTSYPLLENQTQFDAPNRQDYRIGPGDSINIDVWENPDISVTTPVRPDGKATLPLVQDIQAEGQTPYEFARSVETALKKYINDPIVTVTVLSFVGTFSDKVRVVGEAQQPQAVPYRTGMTLLDLMIQVGGLTDFAAGNRATLIRKVEGRDHQFSVRLDDLVKDGDISANALVYPGDIIIIPEAYF